MEEFVSYALSQGVKVSIGENDRFLCLQVVLMGWNWAPFVAQSALGAMMDAAFNPGVRSSRLLYKVPTQLLGTKEQCDNFRVQKKLVDEKVSWEDRWRR